MKASISKKPRKHRLQFLAGDLALDFLNTRMRAGGQVVDMLQNDEDVLEWLNRAGLPSPKAALDRTALSLLHHARELRENIRTLVERRKAGRWANPSELNRFLSYAQSHPKLSWSKSQAPIFERVRQQDSSESILAPVAEAAAMLLATADFSCVKRCEGENCILWFCDKTKSHHRRWCSARVCGNRHKVAAYRSRQRVQERQ